MALFGRSKTDRHAAKQAARWGWDPGNANLTGDQAWALLTTAIYFRSVAPRLDTLGGGLEALDWEQGLAAWWDVRNDVEFEELVAWMKADGHRSQWRSSGADDGDDKVAWDYCRLITVSGGAALAQVVSSDRAWELVMEAADVLHERFDSWQQLADNYLSGRILWLIDKDQWYPDPDPSQAQFQQAAAELIHDPSSPWGRTEWDRSVGVVIDGEVMP